MVMAVLTAVILLVTSGHPASEAEQMKPSLPSQALSTAQAAAQKPFVEHTVQAGDTLYAIAVRYNTKIEHILNQNPNINPENLKVGLVLHVPTNTVKKAKTREELAQTADQMVLSSAGEPNRYIRKIPCKLTAYTNSFDSTGKHPGDPGYGITASGQPAKEGLTIAVDPEIIPLHSVVYIPGIGVRYAEDTGGAVKGNHIDVFFNDDNYAHKFGVKDNVPVYILEEGPRES
jgi:3D (Asp-Asp-Asp) domain-containing protein